MIGLKRGTVKLLKHNPRWDASFEQEKKKLKKIFGRDVLDIQHVGSTSISGMLAKPIIDIAVVVPSLKKTKRYVRALKRAGYELKNNDSRQAERLFFTKGPEVRRTHYLHIGEIEGGYIDDMILFRDYLRNHKRAARKYAELKKKLAEQYSERRDIYAKKRKRFVNMIAKKARKSLRQR